MEESKICYLKLLSIRYGWRKSFKFAIFVQTNGIIVHKIQFLDISFLVVTKMAYQSSINVSSGNIGSVGGANQENTGANRRDVAQQQQQRAEWNTARQNAAITNTPPSDARPNASPDIQALLNLHKTGLKKGTELNGRQQAALQGLMSNISNTITNVEKAANQNIALGSKDAKEANSVRLMLDQVGLLLNQLLNRLSEHGGKSKKRKNRNILCEEAEGAHESVATAYNEEDDTHRRLSAFDAIPGILVKITAALKSLQELISGSDKDEATTDVTKDINKVIDQTNHYVSDTY